MSNKSWQEIADEQYRNMPASFRKDWKDLRKLVNKSR